MDKKYKAIFKSKKIFCFINPKITNKIPAIREQINKEAIMENRVTHNKSLNFNFLIPISCPNDNPKTKTAKISM